jgi:hypothetical protein
VRQRTRDQFLRAPATRAYRPCERLRVTEETAVDVNVGDDLVALGVLRADDVDGRQNGREHREEACVGDVTAGADAAAETEARCARVTDGRVDLAVGSEISLRLERVWLRVVLGVV